MSEEQRLAGIEKLARAYFKLLSSIDWEDPVLVGGLREGLNKFLSNAHLASFRGYNKYHKTHFVSRQALHHLESRLRRGLVWEHLVPRKLYIQEPCERQARERALTLDFIRDRLAKFWYLASITNEEDRLLPRLTMPANWDGNDVLARYEAAGLTLIPNPFFDRLTDEESASPPIDPATS
jgi:hypothetical protein